MNWITKRATVPIRDTWKAGMPISFVLEFYGLEASQLFLIQIDNRKKESKKPPKIDKDIGSWPIRRALERRGFDTDRYMPFVWEIA